MVPCYNESESLPFLYEELNKLMNSLNQYDWEVLFVNDGSKDETIEVIKKLFNEDNRIAYVDLSRNFGKEKAMLAGFDYVTGDCLMTIAIINLIIKLKSSIDNEKILNIMLPDRAICLPINGLYQLHSRKESLC